MGHQTLPLVSIITPSFNQAAFIQETIESILIQDYPHVEHIVIDGGSTDGTLAILQKYSRLGLRFRFISEQDRGQSHAINKGLKMAAGEIIGWLNSDDTYLPGAIRKAVDALLTHPDWGVVYGKAHTTNEENQIMHDYPVQPFDRKSLFDFCIICQPAAFVRKQVFDAIGGVDEELDFCMDYDLWMRVSKHYQFGYVNHYLANSRSHPSCKSVLRLADTGIPEIVKSSVKHFGTISKNWLYHFLQYYSDMGVYWYLNLFKSHSIFGQTPKIIEMNRFSDNWVPPRFRVTIHVDPKYPLHMLVIKGTFHRFVHRMHCQVLVDGQPVQVISIEHDALQIEIPSHSKGPTCIVDFLFDQQFIPAERGFNSDTRTLSFVVNEILALSDTEYSFYQAFQKGAAVRWVQNNWHPAPSL